MRVVIFVDDLIVIGDNDAHINEVKLHLKQKSEMKNLGELCYYLSIELLDPLVGYGYCRGSITWTWHLIYLAILICDMTCCIFLVKDKKEEAM